MRKPPLPIPGPEPKPPKYPFGKKLLPKAKKTVAEHAADAIEEQKKNLLPSGTLRQQQPRLHQE